MNSFILSLRYEWKQEWCRWWDQIFFARFLHIVNSFIWISDAEEGSRNHGLLLNTSVIEERKISERNKTSFKWMWTYIEYHAIQIIQSLSLVGWVLEGWSLVVMMIVLWIVVERSSGQGRRWLITGYGPDSFCCWCWCCLGWRWLCSKL